MALATLYRLKKEKDFESVIKQGKTVKSSFFFIKFIHTTRDVSRVGIAISSKTATRAVDRNYIKRILHNELQKLWPSLKPSYDIVIMVAKPSVTLTSELLRQKFTELIMNSPLT